MRSSLIITQHYLNGVQRERHENSSPKVTEKRPTPQPPSSKYLLPEDTISGLSSSSSLFFLPHVWPKEQFLPSLEEWVRESYPYVGLLAIHPTERKPQLQRTKNHI